MTSSEFVALSTKLLTDMRAWIAEASKDESLSPADLALLQETMKIVEKVTLTEATIEAKPDTAN